MGKGGSTTGRAPLPASPAVVSEVNTASTLTVSDLAQTADVLGPLTKRTELIQATAKLLARASVAEIGPLVYLLQGRLAPLFSPLEIAFGDALAAESIAAAYGKERQVVEDLVDHVGDLGTVARELSGAGAAPLGLLAAYRELVAIAEEKGGGSQLRRRDRFAALLRDADPSAAEFLVRLSLGKLRLGVKEATIIEALAIARTGRKDDKPLIEVAYYRSSDLGAVARQYFTVGSAGLAEFSIVVGHPVLPALAEALPDAQTIVSKLGPVYVEGKYDGMRLQVHKKGPHVQLFSRNLEEQTAMWPEVVSAIATELACDEAILEGEVLAVDPGSGEMLPFQETAKRRRKHNVAEKAADIPVRFFAFDALLVDGRDLTGVSYPERRAALLRTIPERSAVLAASRSDLASTSAEVQRLFEAYVAEGLEGIICKTDAPYRVGKRTFDWTKLKRGMSREMTDSVDCVVIGYNLGEGKRTALGAGALLLAVYDSETDEYHSICKLGTGMTDAQMVDIIARVKPLERSERPTNVRSRLIPDRWVTPEVVLEVMADEITVSPTHVAGAVDDGPGYALRFPRLERIRDDKRADEATSVERIRTVFSAQRTRKV